jgi:hypothetical protein
LQGAFILATDAAAGETFLFFIFLRAALVCAGGFEQ